MRNGDRTIRSETSYRSRWARRVALGAMAGVGAFGLAAACISGHAPLAVGDGDPLASARGTVDGGPAPRTTGPVALARCDDGSHAFFELDRTGSTHLLSGSFVSPDDGSARRLVAEFHHAEGDGSEGVSLVGLSGAVTRQEAEVAEPTGAEEIPLAGSAPRKRGAGPIRASAARRPNVQTLASVTLSGLEDPSEGGRVSFQFGKTLLELSGCSFNLSALKRVRGQEHAPLVAYLRR